MIEVVLPQDPPHGGSVIEARNDQGGMVVAWRDYDGLRWTAFAGNRSRRPEDWANIVEFALRGRLQLFLAVEDIRPYRGQEDDGDTD